MTTPPSNSRLMVVICAATFFGVLNASAVNVVLPEIGAAFGVGAGSLGWVMSLFLLTYGVAIPFYGGLAERFGERRLFVIGLGLFGFGSLVCAASPGLTTLLLARFIQGIGGAAFPGLGMTLVSRAFPESKRGTALGFIAATMGVGAAVGPLVGGVAADLASWRLLFGVSALALLLIPFARRYLPQSEVNEKATVDVLGGGLLATVVALTLYAVAEVGQTGFRLPVMLAFATACALLVFLVRHHRAVAAPFVPRELVQSSAYRRAVTMSFFTTGSYLAALIGLPLLLAQTQELSPSEIGAVLLPEAMLTALVGVLAGRLTDRFGARLPTFVGALAMVIVAIGFSTVAGGSTVLVAVFGGVLGAGYALLNTPIVAAIGSLVPKRALASALSLNAMFFFIGGSFGTTAFVTVAEARVGSASSWNPLHGGTGAGFSDAFLVFAAPMLVTAVLALALPRRKDASQTSAQETRPTSVTPMPSAKPAA